MKSKYKNAIVTGASSGIGAELSLYLAKNKCHVLAVGRDAKKLAKQRGRLSPSKQKYFHAYKADINVKSTRSRLLKAAQENGRVDLLISNAGVGVSKSFEHMTDDEVELVITTNLLSPIKLIGQVIGSTLRTSKQSKLQIVIVTSLAGKMGFPELSTYSASKFGLEGFAEVLRHDLKQTNISICVLRPGVTDTGFFNVAGMHGFYDSVKGKKVLHSAESVAEELFEKLSPHLEELTIGSDKYALKVLPFFKWNNKLKALDLINKF